jgi:hypothetical protein
MIAFGSKKKLFKLRFCAILGLLLNGCYLFQTELAHDPEVTTLVPCSGQAVQTHGATVTTENWALSLTYKSTSTPLITARTPWGSPLRYVYPYPRQLRLFELSLENTSASPIQIPVLHLQNGAQILTPLSLETLKQYWPATGVWSSETLLDRAAALGEITRTLFSDNPILPGTQRKGYFAFPTFTPRVNSPVQIVISGLKNSPDQVHLSFCQTLSPKP